MDGELAYWRGLSGLPTGLSIDDYRHSYLSTLTGLNDSIMTMFQVYCGGELAYWRTASGLSNASFAHAKVMALTPNLTVQTRLYRAELDT